MSVVLRDFKVSEIIPTRIVKFMSKLQRRKPTVEATEAAASVKIYAAY